MQNLDLVILAGGKGTRIKNKLKGKPKPLININKKPFIYYILNHFSKFNFETIYILAGYKGNLIKKIFDNKLYNLTKIKVIIEDHPLGTGGALSLLKKKIKNNFLLLNGDSILTLPKIPNLKKNTVFLTKNYNYKSNSKLNNIDTDKQNNIIFSKNSNFMNAGVYYLKKNFLNLIKKDENISLEDDILVDLINCKKIKGIKTNNFFLDIGTLENLKKAPSKLRKIFFRPAIFLDRDGVINYDDGYTHKYEDFKFKKNVLKALDYCRKKNYYIFIVTNQAGIAKGFYTINDFINLHLKISKNLKKKNIYFDDIKFSPFHPKGVVKIYKKTSNFRKPGNLMIKELIKKWHINKNKSFMIGDKKSDYLAARKSKIYFEFDIDNLYKQVSKIIKKFA